MSQADRKPLIIGLGNRYRRDDGVGLIIAARLAWRASDKFTVIEHSGEGAALMETWKDADTVIIIDAVRSGAAAGTLHRFEASAQQLPTNFFNYSTHAFSLAEAIEMARILKQLPEQVIVYGIEGEDFTWGTGLSPAVERAAQKVEEKVFAENCNADSAKTF